MTKYLNTILLVTLILMIGGLWYRMEKFWYELEHGTLGKQAVQTFSNRANELLEKSGPIIEMLHKQLGETEE